MRLTSVTFLVALVVATGLAGYAIERAIVARDRARTNARRPAEPTVREYARQEVSEPVREPARAPRPMRAPAARPPVRRPAAPYFGQPPGRTVPLDTSYRRWRPQGGVPR